MSSRQIGWLGWLAVVLFALIGMALFLIGFANAGQLRPNISLELAKGGLQLALVSVGGAIIAALVRSIDANREARRRAREYLLQTLAETVAAYNGVKAGRRRLRAIGLRYAAMGAMSDEQETSFLAEMGSLNELQLSLEALRRRTEQREDVFGSDVPKALGRLDNYVGHAFEYWEKRYAPDRAEVEAAWSNLTGFVGSAKGGFENASMAMDDIEKSIAERLRRV